MPYPHRYLIYFIYLIIFLHQQASAQAPKRKGGDPNYVPAVFIILEGELAFFKRHIPPSASYSITICGDVPNNKKPHMVAYNQQTGHVFLILQVIDSIKNDTSSQVFGFYPKKGLPTLFFKTIKSKMMDNSERNYDVSITKHLTRAEFDTVLEKSLSLSKRIYHINKYNCYDYALFVFNSVAGKDALPTVHVRFPFVFGKGGSPVGLYKDMERLKNNGSPWAPFIKFGEMKAPVSDVRIYPDNVRLTYPIK
jgi:hypothetical protein